MNARPKKMVQYHIIFFGGGGDNTELKSFTIGVRSAKPNNYAENIKYHVVFIDDAQVFIFFL